MKIENQQSAIGNPLYPAHNKQIAARMLDGEMMIMSARDSTLFSLNGVGSVIWAAADGQTPLHEIAAQKVCAEFEVSPKKS